MAPQAPATLPADFFSKMPPDTLPANFDFSQQESKQAQGPSGSAFSRFLTHATGLPVSDIAAHPGAYLNPLSREYWQKGAEQNSNQSTIPTTKQMLWGRLGQDLSDKNFAGAAGDILPAVMTAGTLAASRFARMPQPLPPRALPAGPIEMPGEVEASPTPAYSPTTRAERLGLLLPKGSEPVALPGQIEQPAGPPYATTTTAERMGRLLPEVAGGKIELPDSSLPKESEVSYPGALQKRPTDRGEIISDKAIEDAMRNDLERQGWSALSQERKEFYANNGPQMSKGDLVTQARVDAIRAEAEQRVQQVLAEATKPVRLTRMPKAKSPAAAEAQPVQEDLNSPSRLIDLMQQSLDAINARKGK